MFHKGDYQLLHKVDNRPKDQNCVPRYGICESLIAQVAPVLSGYKSTRGCLRQAAQVDVQVMVQQIFTRLHQSLEILNIFPV